MAEETDGGFRVVITSLRQPRADAGTVYVTAYQRHGGGWRASNAVLIGSKGAFSWSAVGMTGAVRRFSVRERDRSTTFELRISPAVGWSNPYGYRLKAGRLVGGVVPCGCAPQN